MTVLSLLSPDAETGYDDDWFARVEASLRKEPDDWIAAVQALGSLGQAEAWELLGWVEVAASRVVRSRSRDTLVLAALGLSLALRSQLDQRDCLVVAALLRRAATLCAFDYASAIREGCGRAGVLGGDAQQLLLTAFDRIPSTHEESGTGESFMFVRRPVDFEVSDLERWLESGGDQA